VASNHDDLPTVVEIVRPAPFDVGYHRVVQAVVVLNRSLFVRRYNKIDKVLEE
jgi:hypothetical protein